MDILTSLNIYGGLITFLFHLQAHCMEIREFSFHCFGNAPQTQRDQPVKANAQQPHQSLLGVQEIAQRGPNFLRALADRVFRSSLLNRS